MSHREYKLRSEIKKIFNKSISKNEHRQRTEKHAYVIYTSCTANEGRVRIRYRCLVPIYVFPEMKLGDLVIMFCLPIPHSCICERFIYSHDQSVKDQLREYINRSQIHKCRNWERGCAVSFLGIYVLNFRDSVYVG